LILPTRLGVKGIEKCYFNALKYCFTKFNNLFMGAMGGRPGQALYFVGLQGDELIFLDPHLV